MSARFHRSGAPKQTGLGQIYLSKKHKKKFEIKKAPFVSTACSRPGKVAKPQTHLNTPHLPPSLTHFSQDKTVFLPSHAIHNPPRRGQTPPKDTSFFLTRSEKLSKKFSRKSRNPLLDFKSGER